MRELLRGSLNSCGGWNRERLRPPVAFSFRPDVEITQPAEPVSALAGLRPALAFPSARSRPHRHLPIFASFQPQQQPNEDRS